MKFLITFACALAAASASNLVATPIPGYYPGSQHLPVIGANGVPVETPAVQQATAEHLVHKVEAHVRNGDYAHQVVGHAPVASAVYPITAGVAGVTHGSVAEYHPGSQHLPVIGANGVPVDTPAVQQATAEHLVHKVEAHTRNGDYAHPVVGNGLVSSAVYPIPAGVSGVTHGSVVAPVFSGYYPAAAGVTGVSQAGVPLETPEVAAAKINHFAAHAEALARTGYTSGAYAFPYSHLYRARRGVVTPVAFNTYAHTPVVAQTYTSFPYAHNSAVFYRKRRGVVAPVAYSGYSHTPVVHSGFAHSYSAFPYVHHY